MSSLRTGDVPPDWRKANISPIPKKGKVTDSLNYRPVSLTSILCKVMERIIWEGIVQHRAPRNELITDAQHGFINRGSCFTNMLCYLDDLVNAVDSRHCIDVNYLDCKKAFDRVPHERHVMKLRARGIDGEVLGWTRSFLTDRSHQVCIRKGCSDWLPVHSRVPQGSVLGPVLFLIYINDIINCLKSMTSLFVDDAKVYKVLKSRANLKALRRDMKHLRNGVRNGFSPSI